MDGELKGSIECESEVVIGPTAKIEATIKAATIKINGQVKGDLFASARMEVLSQGRIQGNLTNLPGSLIIHEGGIVEGQCLTTSKEEINKVMPPWINASGLKQAKDPVNKWILKKIHQQSLKMLSQVMTQKSLKKLPDLS